MVRPMRKRDVIACVLNGNTPPYVPWSFSFTQEAHKTLAAHAGDRTLEDLLQNHLLGLGSGIGFFDALGEHRYRDVFGVVWDRSIDRDIGNVEAPVLPRPTLSGYTFPDPHDPRFFADIPDRIAAHPDCYRVFEIGFSLYERAWTLRGLENLMMDFFDHPGFVHELFDAIVDYNLAQVEKALTYDIDAIYFGDDWGMQHGLQMGYATWHTFIRPALRRMYSAVRDAGKRVFIHSCGDVDELFDDLVDLGVNCFNPFQPEVMDVHALLETYRGRLTFHGGLSTQRTLPFGSVADVETETRALLERGRVGSYILAPAHAVEGDVPIDNMLAFIRLAQAQPGFVATHNLTA